MLESLRLRIKDVDVERRQVIVREGKGNRDRATVLPRALEAPLLTQLGYARTLYDQDRQANRPGVYLPHALAKKYPTAAYDWAWQDFYPHTEFYDTE